MPSGPTNIYIGILKAEHDFGFATLSSITGYQASHALVTFQGGSPILGSLAFPTAFNMFYEKNKTFSQELQLTSRKSDSRFDWVVGAFYYDDHTELRLDTIGTCIGGVCAGATPTRSDGFPSTRSGSIYGDGTYRFFTSTKVTIGLRYTNEDKALTGTLTPLPGYANSVVALPPTNALFPGATFIANVNGVPTLQPGIPTKLNFDRLTYRGVLQQDIGDDIHLYVQHNLGFKSGAYNGNLFSNPPVNPELLYATEGGIKTELLDRRLRLNGSYFHYTYKNVQVRSIAPPAPPGNAFLQNIASERVDGIDADFSAVPLRGLTINGTLEHLIARYVDYPGATRVTQGPNRVINGITVGSVVNTTPFNLAGFTPQNAPEFSASIGFVYSYDTRLGAFSFSANDHYTSSTSRTNDDSVIDPPHHIVDLSLGRTSASKRYDASLWVKNLGDEYTFAAGQISTNFVVVPGAPRTFGGTVGVHF
ncbi:TonB-dependent receptor domain-containing protein [Sphingomonas bacterium]|uniref:TonB-dependent receptor domain-containing protein n=1 Tax=Sphingomonas bacterium TaxID=1895847 RepID=UPI0034A06E1E